MSTLEELARVRGVGRDVAERRGAEVLAAIERGKAVPEGELPRFERGPRRPEADPAYELRLEKLKVRRNQLATDLGLQPGVLCPNGTLEAIARAQPASVEAMAGLPGLREWQRRELGEALLLETLIVRLEDDELLLDLGTRHRRPPVRRGHRVGHQGHHRCEAKQAPRHHRPSPAPCP